MNKAILIGRLTRDPELRRTGSGQAVATFTLAVNRDFKNDKGEYEADFIQCVAWRATAEFIAKYIQKGDLIGTFGRIQTRNYTTNDNRTVYVTELICEQVQALNTKPQNNAEKQNAQANTYVQDMQVDDTFSGQNMFVDEDDIQF